MWSSCVQALIHPLQPELSHKMRPPYSQIIIQTQTDRKLCTHLLTSKGMMFKSLTKGQKENKGLLCSLFLMLPVVHLYRADVSLGRFAEADWLKATSSFLTDSTSAEAR